MTLRVGAIQQCGLAIYVFDPAVNGTCGDPPFPGSLNGNTLTVEDPDLACALLTEAANSADVDGDAKVRDALTELSRRVRSV